MPTAPPGAQRHPWTSESKMCLYCVNQLAEQACVCTSFIGVKRGCWVLSNYWMRLYRVHIKIWGSLDCSVVLYLWNTDRQPQNERVLEDNALSSALVGWDGGYIVIRGSFVWIFFSQFYFAVVHLDLWIYLPCLREFSISKKCCSIKTSKGLWCIDLPSFLSLSLLSTLSKLVGRLCSSIGADFWCLRRQTHPLLFNSHYPSHPLLFI